MAGTKKPDFVLQDRDRRILTELGVMRIADCAAIKIVGPFQSTRRANARLLQLHRAGYLRRFFVGSVAHGRKSIYTLSQKGQELIGAVLPGINRPENRLIVGDAFVEHQSGINAVYLAVKHRQRAGISVARWIVFRRPISEAMKLTPDGYFEAILPRAVRPMFLEVDLGTEALTVWQKKTAAYVQFALSGEFPKLFHQAQFRVLVVCSSGRRLANLRAAVLKATDRIFWFTTLENIHREGFWSPIWHRPSGDMQHSLL